MLTKQSVIKIKKEFKKIKLRYRQKYSEVLFDIKVKSIDNIIVLGGVVLSGKQKNEVFLVAKNIIKDAKIENKIKVLGDPEENLEIGWGVIVSEIADMWAKFPDKKKLDEKNQAIYGERNRASQALKNDLVRILFNKDNWSLAQTRDLAIGWIKKTKIFVQGGGASGAKNEKLIERWLKAKRIKSGEMIKKHLLENTQKKFFVFLKKYLKAPYLLGGMTERGIDCSGLIEEFFSDIFGIILPRHSVDQALCGGKIRLRDAHFGDLVFLRKKTTKFAHIGVVVEKFEALKKKRKSFNDILILNARRESGGVVIEELSEMLKVYNLISVKRIIK